MTVTTHIVQPPDTNVHGTLFGGTVMGWMDLAAAIEATRVTKGPCVTVCVDKIEFKKPIRLGDIVTIEASIVKLGTTSIAIQVHVYREPINGSPEYCLTGKMTFVAVDENGRPRKFERR